MALESEKSFAMRTVLEALCGRGSAIAADRCVDPPFGCGKPADEFRDDLSRREYTISGLCQACQDEVFSR